MMLKKRKKYIKIKKDRQHVSPSIEKKIKKKTFIFNNKMTASFISNNFQEFEKKIMKVQKVLYH